MLIMRPSAQFFLSDKHEFKKVDRQVGRLSHDTNNNIEYSLVAASLLFTSHHCPSKRTIKEVIKIFIHSIIYLATSCLTNKNAHRHAYRLRCGLVGVSPFNPIDKLCLHAKCKYLSFLLEDINTELFSTH